MQGTSSPVLNLTFFIFTVSGNEGTWTDTEVTGNIFIGLVSVVPSSFYGNVVVALTVFKKDIKRKNFLVLGTEIYILSILEDSIQFERSGSIIQIE